MLRDGVISDELWDVLEKVMPQDAGRRGRPWNDHRRTLEGIIWRFRTGSPWRDLPAPFGPYQSVWERHRLWSTDGTYGRMLAAVRDQTELDDDEVEAILSIDSPASMPCAMSRLRSSKVFSTTPFILFSLSRM